MGILVREETDRDVFSIRDVVTSAFGRVSEGALVDALRKEGYARLSLVAETDGQIVGHILFSDLAIECPATSYRALALAPLAVAPAHQRRGIGSLLVREGLRRAAEAGHRIVVVLGHPNYYPRFGFSSGLARELGGPYSGQPSFMALELVEGAMTGVQGDVKYPSPFARF